MFGIDGLITQGRYTNDKIRNCTPNPVTSPLRFTTPLFCHFRGVHGERKWATKSKKHSAHFFLTYGYPLFLSFCFTKIPSKMSFCHILLTPTPPMSFVYLPKGAYTNDKSLNSKNPKFWPSIILVCIDNTPLIFELVIDLSNINTKLS